MAVSDRIAVMNRGSIAEIGTAETLYHSPRSRFVAEFIGRANLVAAQVIAVRDGYVDVAALDRQLAIPRQGSALAAGTRCLLLLRPEAIVLGEPDATSGTLAGTVRTRTFLGEKIEYTIACAGVTLQVVRHSQGVTDAFAPGAAVGVQIARGAGTLVADASQGDSP